MAEKRMLSKVISVSEKVNTLPDIFDMLLFTWMIPHTDDYGRLPGSPAKVKALVVPMLDRSINDIQNSIERLANKNLIVLYESNGEKAIQIVDFEKHQQGLKNKKASKFSTPNCYLPLNNSHLPSYNNNLSASECDIEELIAVMLINNTFIVGEEFVSVERQYRIDNSYIDILASGKNHGRYLFEIKRQRLSNAAIDQILKYRSMINDPGVICTLVGYGLSTNFDNQRCTDEGINVLIYDDLLNVVISQSFNVNYRQPMLLTNRTEGNRTEEKGIEEEGNGTDSPPPSDPIKNSLLNLMNEHSVKTTIFGLDQIYSYIGVVENEVIETAIKKAAGKHVNYAVNTLQGWVSEGKTKLSQVMPKPSPGTYTAPKGGKPQIEVIQPSTEQTVSEEEFANLIKFAEEMEARNRGKKEEREPA